MNILVHFPDLSGSSCTSLFVQLITTGHFLWEIETGARITAS